MWAAESDTVAWRGGSRLNHAEGGRPVEAGPQDGAVVVIPLTVAERPAPQLAGGCISQNAQRDDRHLPRSPFGGGTQSE